MHKLILPSLLLLLSSSLSSQVLNGLKDRLNNSIQNATNVAKQKAREKAKEQIDKSFEKARNEFDASNFNYAISFSDNSALFETEEKGSRATNYIKEWKEKKEGYESESEKRLDQAYMLMGQGEVWMASNKAALARTAFLAADTIYKHYDSTKTKEYAQLMCDLGLLYQSTRRLTEAEKYIDRCIELRLALMPNSAQHAVVLNNKGVLLKDLGRYNEAEQYFDMALKICKDSFGEKNLGFALALNNKAMLWQAVGKNDQAEALLLRSIDISKELLRESSSNHIKLTINLALLYREMKKYDESEKIYLNALRVKERKLGIFHPDYAHLKRGLAQLYMDMGKTEEVEKNLNSALEIYSAKLGREHPATLGVKNDLGNFYRVTGKKEKALELMTEVESITKNVYGEDHPVYVKVLEDYTIAQWENQKIQEASVNYTSVISKTLKYIDDYFLSLSESEKTKFWDKTTPRFNRFNSFVLSASGKDPSLTTLMFNLQLKTKALLLNSSSKIRNVILTGGDAQLISEYKSWLSAKENLARCYGMSKKEIAEEKINVDSLEQVTDKLEKSLSAKSGLFSEQGRSREVVYTQIQSALKADESVVEIVRVNLYSGKFTGDVAYAALILSKTGEPLLVQLPDGNKMEGEYVASYRKNIMEMKPDNSSYSVFWEPVEKQLGSVRKVYVSPDGIYNQISLNTLKDAGGKYLLDKHVIVLAGNLKDVLKMQAGAKGVSVKTAGLIGNPNYGSNDIVAPLPGTKTEVENVNKILSAAKFSTEVYMKTDATEEKVKAIRSGVLHIATHGFFLSDLNSVRGEKVLGVETSSARKNPLLRSGLMLANCESVFDETGEKGNTNNGILTAYEVMNLSLEGTDLVVLSACQTGLGDIKSGEGVYGLQRSFLVAGAKSVIMSLWEVSDDATMQLMTEFYKNYTATGNKQEAFLSAQKKIRTKYKEPYFWGAFVMVGL